MENKEILEFNKNNKNRALNHGKRFGLSINIENPITIQDKLEWLNIYDVNPLKWECADKIKLHDYCKRVLGEDLCIPILKTYDAVEYIKFNELPNKYVLKCNHGSGMNIIVRNSSTINKESIRRNLRNWLRTDFTFKNGFESHYHWIKPRIFVEELKEDSSQTKSLFDYKFWCFNGEPKMYTINDGNGHGDIMYYKMDDSEYNLYQVHNTSKYKKPLNFEKMVEYSKKLSQAFKFVRVDFYEVNGNIYLGELTFTPGCCHFKYKKPGANEEVGRMLKLN